MLEKEMKEFLNQRMVSYVDILDKPNKNGDTIIFRLKSEYVNKLKLVYQNAIIGTEFVYIKIKNRSIYFIDQFYHYDKIIFELNLDNGYISLDKLEKVDDDNQLLYINYHEFTNEQKEYNEIHDYLYPRYDIHMESFIMNNMLGYKISVNIFLCAIDEEPYIVDLYIPVTTDGGMDLVIDTMIELYNNILSRDFSEFFNIEDIEITNALYYEHKGKYRIVDHHYTDHTFLCVNKDTNLQLQIEYLEYFCSKQYEINFGNSDVLFPDDKEKSIEMNGDLYINDIEETLQKLKEICGIKIDRDPQADLQLLEDDINHLKSPKVDINNFN